MNNAAALNSLHSILADREAADKIESIAIVGAASPEGATAHNKALALTRARVVKSYIAVKYPHLDQRMISTTSIGENWEGLRDMVHMDTSTPYRAEVLNVLDNVHTANEKRARLMAIGGGTAYRYIVANMLRWLREATTIIVCFREEVLREEMPSVVSGEEIIIVETPEREAPKEEVVVAETSHIKLVMVKEPGAFGRSSAPEIIRKPLFAIKTNLLFDIATALNLELEVPIGSRWSIAAEYMFPWWLCEKKQHAFELISGTVEARYWFGRREGRPQMTGWFAGLYGGGGYYDVEWGDVGNQGEFFQIGLSAGYAHAISRNKNWRMEYSLGVGYLRADYREYLPRYGVDGAWHLLHDRDGKFTWFGPTRAKISLVWMINGRKQVKTTGLTNDEGRIYNSGRMIYRSRTGSKNTVGQRINGIDEDRIDSRNTMKQATLSAARMQGERTIGTKGGAR